MPTTAGTSMVFSRPCIFLGPERHGTRKGVFRVHDTPGHRGRGRPVLPDKPARVAVRLGIDDVGNVALLPKLHGLGLVRRDVRVSHSGEQVPELLRLGMSEFDELEPVGSGRVFRRDHGLGRVMRKRTHLRISFCCVGQS